MKSGADRSLRRVVWIAIGDELVDGPRHDTNADGMSRVLRRLGWRFEQRQLIRDDESAITGAIREALDRTGTVILSGGLGPTPDDCTRAGIVRALGEPPEFIKNPVGTAPALRWTDGKRRLVALPGVPTELFACWEAVTTDWWPDGPAVASPVVYRFAGISERRLADCVDAAFHRDGWETAILAAPGEVELHIAGTAFDDTARTDWELWLKGNLGEFWLPGDNSGLVDVVARALINRSWNLAVAESCTAGMLAARLTENSGASGWFLGGTIVYSDAMKVRLLGVDAARLEAEGAVSEWTARRLAIGVRQLTGAELGLSITGIAGPSGGRPGKPVGTVWFGIDGPRGTYSRVRFYRGDRTTIRRWAVADALDGIRRYTDSSAATLALWKENE